MQNNNSPQPYRAYLIRCWQIDPASHPQQDQWRFSLEFVNKGERYGFTDPQKMLAFLQAQIEGVEIDSLAKM